MLHIRYSIISYHRRRKHLIGLMAITLLGLLSQYFLSSISLGEGQYISSEISFTIIEIVGLIFVLYFGSTTIQTLTQNKILYLLRAKKEDSHAIIGGILGGLMTIVTIYTSIAFVIAALLGGWLSTISITGRIGLTFVLYITTMIVVLFSLLSNSYLAFMSGLIIYAVSYSINFLVESAQIQKINGINEFILNIMKYIFPRFDLLSTQILSLSSRIRVIIGHTIYSIALYFIINKIFSSRYSSQVL